MRELLRTNDFVLVSYLEAVLADAGIGAVVLDGPYRGGAGLAARDPAPRDGRG